MFITMDDLESDGPITPRRLGFCSNLISTLHYCGNVVLNDDIEAVELSPEGNRRVFVCGPCVEKLLTLQPQIHEPEKSNIKGSNGKRLPGARIRYTGGEIIR